MALMIVVLLVIIIPMLVALLILIKMTVKIISVMGLVGDVLIWILKVMMMLIFSICTGNLLNWQPGCMHTLPPRPSMSKHAFQSDCDLRTRRIFSGITNSMSTAFFYQCPCPSRYHWITIYYCVNLTTWILQY